MYPGRGAVLGAAGFAGRAYRAGIWKTMMGGLGAASRGVTSAMGMMGALPKAAAFAGLGMGAAALVGGISPWGSASGGPGGALYGGAIGGGIGAVAGAGLAMGFNKAAGWKLFSNRGGSVWGAAGRMALMGAAAGGLIGAAINSNRAPNSFRGLY